MNPVILALYDRKAQTFNAPAFYPDLASGERAFVGLLSSGDSVPAMYPEDFSLYHLGAINPCTGELIPLQHPSLVITGQSAMLVASRLRRGGSELSRGVTPSEDKAVRPDVSDVGSQPSIVSSDSDSGSVHSSSAPDDTPSFPL